METLYRSICSALDMKPRTEALNAKLNHCEHLLEVLRALLTEQSSHHMELIIIYLIAFEAAWPSSHTSTCPPRSRCGAS